MSFANLFASSLQTLANIHGKDDGTLHSTLSFFGGIVLILLIDKLIPHYENPHEMHRVEEMSLKEERKTEIKPQLLRVDVVTALVLAIHNFPEGYGYVSCSIEGYKHCYTYCLCHRHT